MKSNEIKKGAVRAPNRCSGVSNKSMKIAKELKEKLRKVVALVDMKIFGSCARGDNDEYSDLDVFIEVEELDKNTKNIIREVIWETGFNNGCMVISPLLFTRQELEKTPIKASDIVRNIIEEGIAI